MIRYQEIFSKQVWKAFDMKQVEFRIFLGMIVLKIKTLYPGYVEKIATKSTAL